VTYLVDVEICGLEGLADPEGLVIERSLPALGFFGIREVHVGKVIRFEIDASSEDEARKVAESLCDRLLANPVTEHAEIRIGEATKAAKS